MGKFIRFFSNLPVWAKYLSSSLLVIGFFTIISGHAIGAINNCHLACRQLIRGAFTTKTLAQSVQTSFYALAETANQALFFTHLGNDAKGSELQRQFDNDALALDAALDGVLQALKADQQVDQAIITELAILAARVKIALNTEYVPLINKLAASRQYGGDDALVSADFAQASGISQKIAVDIDGVEE